MPETTALLAAYGDVEDPLYLAEKDNRYLTFRRALGLLGPAAGRSSAGGPGRRLGSTCAMLACARMLAYWHAE